MLVALLEHPNPKANLEFEQYLAGICDFIENTIKLEGYTNQKRLLDICGIIIDMTKLNARDEALKKKLTMPYIETLLTVLQSNFS